MQYLSHDFFLLKERFTTVAEVMKQLPSVVSITSDIKQALNKQVEITSYDEVKLT